MIHHVVLSEICEVTMGQAPVGSSYNESGVGHALIAGAGDFGEITPEPKKYTIKPTRISQPDDLILCIRATIGDLNWSNGEYCLGRGVAGLRPITNKLDKNYLWYFIQAHKGQLEARGTGSTFKQVNRSHIEEWKIPLPPLKEQKRIAAILDKADALRRKRQQAIDLTDQLLRSVFLDMFGDPVTNPKGWTIGKIGDLLSHVNYGTSAKAGETGEYPILRMNNITYDGNWNLNSLKYIDMHEKDRKKYTAEKGDILFNRTNSKELVGKTAVFEENTPFIFAGYLVRGKVNNLANPYYISAYMNSVYGKTILQHMCKSIVGMANINAKEFQSIKIPIPPIEEQDKYSRLLEQAKKNISHYEKCMLDCDLLFNSLTQQAFRGELTKQNKAA